MKAYSYQILLYFLLFSSHTISSQDTIRVPLEQPTIQKALDSADHNTVILVSPGVYMENPVWPQTKYGIKLISTHGPDSTIIDGNQLKRVLEKYSYLDDFNSLIQGFTIQNGNSNEHGAGLYIYGKGTTLRDLVVKNNSCTNYSNGAGANLTSYEGIIDNCIFRDNNVYSFFSSEGGGMWISSRGTIEIINSTFQNNSAGGQSTNSANGAGLYVSMGDTRVLNIRNCRFTGNINKDETWTRGAALYVVGGTVTIDSSFFGSNKCNSAKNSYGGAIYSEAIKFTLLNSELSYNIADSGLAVMFYRDEAVSENLITNSRFWLNSAPIQISSPVIEMRSTSASLELRNCLIGSNDGKAIYVTNKVNPKSELTVNHCTLGYNVYGIEAKNTIVNVQNSILKSGYEEIILKGTATAKVNSSFVEGGYTGGGNTSGDPLLESFYDFSLKEGSPCLAAANPAFAEPFDIHGNTRPLPSNTLPDMGAIEINQKISYADVRFYLDENENGYKDTEEVFISLGAFKYQNDISYSNSTIHGTRVPLDTGLISIAFDSTLLSDWKITSQGEFQLFVDTALSTWNIQFGMVPISNVIVANTFISGDPFRCGEIVNVHITLSNEYAPIYNEILWLEVDDALSTSLFDIAPDTVVSDHLMGWFISQLFPGEKITYGINASVPLIGGGAQIGDTYVIKSWIGGSPEESLFRYSAALRCSYDPNDKMVSPHRDDNVTFLDETLLYTIRFQNTGNDYARHVVVTDTLDVNLDPGTFRLINTSHPDHIEVTIDDNLIVQFKFLNIFLLDSTTNFDASQGHVTYSMKPRHGTIAGTTIENKASIYFDFNPPIVTNTVTNRLVNEFPNICNAYTGNDEIICIDVETGLGEVYLGESPVVEGGTPPYTYKWQAHYDGAVNDYPASFFLNDTSIANPLLIQYVDDPVTFYLTITDSLGFECNDTVTLIFSTFIYSLDEKYCHIHPGDSCQLYTSVGGGIEPFSYVWSPSAGLANPNDVHTMAAPQMTTDYSLIVTDVGGCQTEDVFHVVVEPVSTKDVRMEMFKSFVYPNPVSDIARIQIPTLRTAKFDIDIIDVLGRRVEKFESQGSDIQFDCNNYQPGLHFYKITDNGRMISAGKFVVE